MYSLALHSMMEIYEMIQLTKYIVAFHVINLDEFTRGMRTIIHRVPYIKDVHTTEVLPNKR